MPQELTAEQAAARLKAADTLGMPLGPGQPPAFMRTLGEREDWTDLRVYGPLLKQQSPRVMTTVATPPDADGWCSLSREVSRDRTYATRMAASCTGT